MGCTPFRLYPRWLAEGRRAVIRVRRTVVAALGDVVVWAWGCVVVAARHRVDMCAVGGWRRAFVAHASGCFEACGGFTSAGVAWQGLHAFETRFRRQCAHGMLRFP